jgi:anti-sigma regulatory factor (Ser/Thr protein kinase)
MKEPRLVFLLFMITLTLFACNTPAPPVHTVTSNSSYQRGIALMGVNTDSAYYYFNRVVNTSKGSLEIATALNNMAVIQADAGDYFGSQETLLRSLSYLNESRSRDFSCLASDYNELGTSSLNLRNYDPAIYYYNKSLQFTNNEGFRSVVINNKALAYQKKGSYDTSLALYNSVLATSKTDPIKYARVLTNLAITNWMKDSAYRAVPQLMQSLHIREAQHDQWGLNSSYAHLADYYTKIDRDSALHYALNMYQIARSLPSPDDEMEAMQKLIGLGTSNASTYFQRYQHLNDSLQTARNNAKNQFALIRYEAEKAMTDNLRLQRDNTAKQLQIVSQRLLLYGTLAGVTLLFLFTWLWYRKRRQRLAFEAEQALKEQQIKTSQRVHDVVANGLYRIMSEIEHAEDIAKPKLLDSIEKLYEQSRDISYDVVAPAQTQFAQSIGRLITSFANSETKVLVVGNEDATWAGQTGEQKTQLEHILQELLVNMKKHSAAKNVVLKFERQSQRLTIRYTDDGVGFGPDINYGNGLRNTENRIRQIGGTIIFDRERSTGSGIDIDIPISSP